MKHKTWLPLFPGFYGTLYEPDETNEIDEINSQREEKGLPPAEWGDFRFDYAEYMEKVAERAVTFVEDKLNNSLDHPLPFKVKLKFEGIDSPREYNFRNDIINIEVSGVNRRELIKYLRDHAEDLAGYFEEVYTSRSGFISFHSNNIQDWITDLHEGFKDEHKLGGILSAILCTYGEDIDDMTMYYACTQDTYIYATNYDLLLLQ